MKNREKKCRIILFGHEKIFFYIFVLSSWSLRVREHSQMTGNSSTMHPERHGTSYDLILEKLITKPTIHKFCVFVNEANLKICIESKSNLT